MFIALIPFLFSCDQTKTRTAPVEKLKPSYKLGDTVKFPYKRKNMKLDSFSAVLNVSYGHVACECAQWVTNEHHYIYVEPANNKLTNADSLSEKYWGIELQLTGSFYKEPGYPIGYNPAKGLPDPAKVFKYNKLRIIRLTKL